MNLLEKSNYGKISEERKYWLVRAGVEGTYSLDFEKGNFIALGWDRINSPKITENLENFKLEIGQNYPEIKEENSKNFKRKISDISTKLFVFYNQLQVGDIVITPTSDNCILIGQVTSNVQILNSDLFPIINEKDKFGSLIGSLNKKRDVKWLRKVERSKLEPNLKDYIRIYHGLSNIKVQQVITEINRELYSVYTKNDKTHAIFYARETGNIDGYKYAIFIEKMTKLIKIAEENHGEKINFSLKTNIQSPGPLELIVPKIIANSIVNGMNYIFKKDLEALNNIKNPVINEKIKKLAQNIEYDYDDYDFPCSGNY